MKINQLQVKHTVFQNNGQIFLHIIPMKYFFFIYLFFFIARHITSYITSYITLNYGKNLHAYLLTYLLTLLNYITYITLTIQQLQYSTHDTLLTVQYLN